MNDRQAARNAQLPMGEFRKQIMIAAAERNMHCITVPKCTVQHGADICRHTCHDVLQENTSRAKTY